VTGQIETLNDVHDEVNPARKLGRFAADLSFDDIPVAVIDQAKMLILDALGVGLAANAYPFSQAALAAATELGGQGLCSVIGRANRLSLRDAVMVNGIFIHGLDFDDTHLASIVHPTAASLPSALSLAESHVLGGRALLVAYVAAMETAIRIGAAVSGGFHHVGFHATGIVAHFSSAIAAAKLLGLNAEQITIAQGIAASTASGVQVFLEEGAWTKRFHPGWAGVAGITAAHLSASGFRGPSRPYEGKFGLIDTHLQAAAAHVDFKEMAAGLGDDWKLAETAIKPYPVCHFIHGCADAAIEIHDEIGGEEIADVGVFLARDTLPIVAEPIETKQRAKTDYEAKFSAPFVVATCLLKGRFGLPELQDEAIADTHIQALARKIRCSVDPDTAFPKYFSGGVHVITRSGRELRRHVRINSGAGSRALSLEDLTNKFLSSASLTVSKDHALRIHDCVLDLEKRTVQDLTSAFRAKKA
jgi:2-methylcitrate dehydratase PrpD